MITSSKRTLRELWAADKKFLFLMLPLSILFFIINKNYNLSLGIPHGSLQVIGLFIAFFLVFMNQKSYERWWEARIIWGDLVNKSRSWALQVNYLLNKVKLDLDLEDEKIAAIKKELIDRHIGFVHALRIHLRKQSDYSELNHFISDSELKELKEKTNIPTHLLDQQGKRVNEVVPGGVEGIMVQRELNQVLKDFYDCQGMAERIKNTVFPKPYSFFARLIVYVYIFLLPIYLVSEFLADDFTDLDFFAIPLVIFICFVFFSLTKLAEQYENPFENSPHDIPLTTICRTIEVDLKELIGETPRDEGQKEEGVYF